MNGSLEPTTERLSVSNHFSRRFPSLRPIRNGVHYSLHKSSLYSCQTCPDLTQADQQIRRKKNTVGHHPTQPCCLKSRHDCKSDIGVTAAILEDSGMAAREETTDL